ASLGSCCGVDDLRAIIKAKHLCQEMGLDPISTGITISCGMEMFERGLIPENETEIALKFGDAQVMLEMVKLMGQRRGFGNVLAEGACRLAEKYGHPEIFMGVKGQECPPCDPRGIQGLGLQYATANNGACYETGYTIIEEVLGLHDEVAPREIEGKAALVKYMQDLGAMLDSAGVCHRMLFSGMSTIEVFAAMEMVAAAGLNDTELLQVGERVFNMERLFNTKAGLKVEDDTLPKRMLEEPLIEGRAKDQVSRLNDMLPEYYRLRGWDDAGQPTPETQAKLGFGE
ncbi:aldehyde ferredoxin oxidoreductase C-terminal domain-containing protein, partial [Chloroflexota bacterium]